MCFQCSILFTLKYWNTQLLSCTLETEDFVTMSLSMQVIHCKIILLAMCYTTILGSDNCNLSEINPYLICEKYFYGYTRKRRWNTKKCLWLERFLKAVYWIALFWKIKNRSVIKNKGILCPHMTGVIVFDRGNKRNMWHK